jgi:hypothetical protein
LKLSKRSHFYMFRRVLGDVHDKVQLSSHAIEVRPYVNQRSLARTCDFARSHKKALNTRPYIKYLLFITFLQQ